MATQVKVIDHGAEALLRAVAANKFRTLKVGILAPDSDVKYTGRQGPTTVGEAAFFNEFGTENIPARSWLRDWVDANITQLRSEQLNLYQAVLLLRTQTEKGGLEALGALYESRIQARIGAGIPPGNRDFTIAKKGFDHPLIDSGLFVDRISHQVSDPK